MKRNKGNAYIFVMIAAMAMLMLASAVLLITANSRRATARHANFTGLYDLAVAGNRQALTLMQQGGLDNLRLHSFPYSYRGNQYYRHEWDFSIDFILPDGRLISDIYQANTRVRTYGAGFRVYTNVRKQTETGLGFPVTVQARIIWPYDKILTNYLDYSMLKMVELLRVAD